MIDQREDIRTAIVQLTGACGLATSEDGTKKLINILRDAIKLMDKTVDWKDKDSNAEGGYLDVLVEMIDSTAEWSTTEEAEEIRSILGIKAPAG